MLYRGYRITTERTPHGRVIWVETRDGPFDAPTMKRACQYIDALVEEDLQKHPE